MNLWKENYQGPSDTCSAQTIYRELSADAKQAILDKHNELRRKVAKGEETDGAPGPQPAASNMRKLVSRKLLSTLNVQKDICKRVHRIFFLKLPPNQIFGIDEILSM